MRSLLLLTRRRLGQALLLFLCATQIATGKLSGSASSDAYTIGVYYFPGWRVAPPLFHLDPWRKLKSYAAREPLIGWYHDGDDAVTNWQVTQMARAGINLVIYDWYWLPKDGVALNHAIDSFRRTPNKRDVSYSILWANHSGVPKSEAEFYEIVRYWIGRYFKESAYYKINGHPVVVVFAPVDLDTRAHSFGRSTRQLFDGANELARKAGLPDIYFVAATQAVPGRVDELLPQAGYQALTAYNYQGSRGDPQAKDPRESHSYRELTTGYAESWDWILRNGPLPYWVPVSAGWDKRPWGGSADPLHDLSESSPKSFEEHLRAAKQVVDENSEKTGRTVVICCWNEYGEGSYVEPTKKYGTKYVDVIRSVFGER
jgi:hypothetical protein